MLNQADRAAVKQLAFEIGQAANMPDTQAAIVRLEGRAYTLLGLTATMKARGSEDEK